MKERECRGRVDGRGMESVYVGEEVMKMGREVRNWVDTKARVDLKEGHKVRVARKWQMEPREWRWIKKTAIDTEM